MPLRTPHIEKSTSVSNCAATLFPLTLFKINPDKSNWMKKNIVLLHFTKNKFALKVRSGSVSDNVRDKVSK